jgi:hypothetical protein
MVQKKGGGGYLEEGKKEAKERFLAIFELQPPEICERFPGNWFTL